MAKHHEHRHPHPHRRKKSGHHHPIIRKGKRPSELAHPHPIGIMYGRPRPPSVATPKVKTVWRRIYTWFPQAVSLGVFNCRRIAGSSTWSEHAYGDALDISSPQAVKTGRADDYLKAVAAYVAQFPSKLVQRVIFLSDAAHQNHAHIDPPPDRNKLGPPECA